MRNEKLQKVAVAALEDIKARDIDVFDVRKRTSLYDTLIIASADSQRQVKALAQHVRDQLKDAGATILGIEGEQSAEWVLVDAGDLVVHVMQPAVRQYYNLEELWGDGKFDKVVNSSEPVAVKRKPASRARKKADEKGAPRRRAA